MRRKSRSERGSRVVCKLHSLGGTSSSARLCYALREPDSDSESEAEKEKNTRARVCESSNDAYTRVMYMREGRQGEKKIE